MNKVSRQEVRQVIAAESKGAIVSFYWSVVIGLLIAACVWYTK